MELIAEDYELHFRRVGVDAALVLDQVLGIYPAPDADRDAYDDPAGDDEFGRAEP